MYLALYRKYRPQTFDDVVSQEHITKTLKNQITSGKTAHAYLFTGSRGTGKTTCAKIFAKAVNCLHPDKNGEPCLKCEACLGIEDGSVTDVVEIDAASNNGVENIRELRETAFFTPTFAKYRVYIIDEVHMLSVPAFNALLKIMEEPPAHVKFVLATTEVHKVPITVISRCQRFDFKRIKDEDIASRLKYIAKKENVSLDDDASMLIARLADGALRDGISLLDRILSATDKVTLEAVENSVGVAGSDYLFELADCIAEYNSAAALAVVSELYMGSKDLQRLTAELINHFRNLMLIKALNGDCGDLVKVSGKDYERLASQHSRFTMGQILNTLTRLQECYDKIGKSSGKRIEFEMCMIRLCTPKTPTATGTTPPQPIPRAAVNIPKFEAEEKTEPKKEEVKEEVIKNDVQESEEVKNDNNGFLEVPEWSDITNVLALTAPHLAMIKDKSKALIKDDKIYIRIDSSLLNAQLKRDGNIAYLQQAIRQVLGRDYTIKLKADSEKKSEEKKAEEKTPLDTLLENANSLGIEIEE